MALMRLHDFVGGPLAHGAGDRSRLAEAAAARAAALNFDDATIVRDFDVGHDLANRCRRQRGHQTFLDAGWGGVERGWHRRRFHRSGCSCGW